MKIALLKDRVMKLQNELIAIRRDLHMHPEIGGNEYRTSETIRQTLKSFGFSEKQIECGIVKTGVLATIVGKFPGPTVMTRVDMDALANCEDLSGAAYASKNENVCHACGHDVHTAVGLGTAKLLLENRERLHGAAKIFFQPSEELPVKIEGRERGEFSRYTESPRAVRAAFQAIEEGVLTRPPEVDRLLGVHCWPELEVGKVGFEPETAMAGSANFHLKIIGRSGHAGTPEASIDAIVLAAEIVQALQTVVSRRVSPSVPVVLNVGTICGGTRRSTVAGRTDLTGTARCADAKYLKRVIPDIMEACIAGICGSAGGSYEFDYHMDLPPTRNSEETLQEDTAALKRVLGDDVRQLTRCPMTAEDFALLAERRPASFLKLGTRGTAPNTRLPLHNGAFDVDEGCLSVGVIAASSIVLSYLGALE